MLLLLHKLHNQRLSLGFSLGRRGRGGIILHIGVVRSLMLMFETMSPPPASKECKIGCLSNITKKMRDMSSILICCQGNGPVANIGF